MSVNAGRIGTPPQKGRMHISGDAVLPLLLLFALVLVIAWLIALGAQTLNTNVTPRLAVGEMALYEQRVGEWAASTAVLAAGHRAYSAQRAGEWSMALSALAAQRALLEQRVGEWNAGRTLPVTIPQMHLDTGWQARMADARSQGIR